MTHRLFFSRPHAALQRPVIEAFRVYNDDGFVGEVPAVRSGPDRMDTRALDESPWPIAGVAYWYQEHFKCRDCLCRCQEVHRFGDGLCAIRYADGRYGVYALNPNGHGRHAIDWQLCLLSKQDRLREREFLHLLDMYQRGLGIARWWAEYSPDAVPGMIIAVFEARRRGVFP